MHRQLSHSFVMLSFGVALLACAGGGDRRQTPDSTSGTLTALTDTTPLPARRASDATLTVDATLALHPALRAVVDSFSSREAVRVVVWPNDGQRANDRAAPDLFLLLSDDSLRVASDSIRWTLPFAQLDIALDSAINRAKQPPTTANADSATNATSNQRRPRRRNGNTKRKSTSTAKKDSAEPAPPLPMRRVLLAMPGNAPNSAVAERFVRYLLTDGRATLLRSGLHVLPRLELYGDGAQPGIVSMVDTMRPPATPRVTPDSLRITRDSLR